MRDSNDQSARPRPSDPAAQPYNRVDETSEESFPASDSPSWAPPSRVGPAPRDGGDLDAPSAPREG